MKTRIVAVICVTIITLSLLSGCGIGYKHKYQVTPQPESTEVNPVAEASTEVTETESVRPRTHTLDDTSEHSQNTDFGISSDEMTASETLSLLKTLTPDDITHCSYAVGDESMEIAFVTFNHDGQDFAAVAVNDFFGTGDVNVFAGFKSDEAADGYTIKDNGTGKTVTIAESSDVMNVRTKSDDYSGEMCNMKPEDILDSFQRLVNGERNLK